MQRDAAARRRVPQGIFDKILQNSTNLFRGNANGVKFGFDGAGEGNAPLFCLQAETLQDVGHQITERGRFEFEHEVAGIELG